MSDEKTPIEEKPTVEQPEHDLPVAEPETTPEILDPETESEPVEESLAGPDPNDLIALLQENLDLTKKLEEAQRTAAYALSDYQNFRKRSDERAAEEKKYRNADFIKDLLPVLDNFERAMTAAEQSQNFEALIGGIKGTLKQLQTALDRAGVKPIEAVGQEFDPNFHEAIGHAESDEYPSNTVVEDLQRGYILHDRVLRPSMVRVTD